MNKEWESLILPCLAIGIPLVGVAYIGLDRWLLKIGSSFFWKSLDPKAKNKLTPHGILTRGGSTGGLRGSEPGGADPRKLKKHVVVEPSDKRHLS